MYITENLLHIALNNSKPLQYCIKYFKNRTGFVINDVYLEFLQTQQGVKVCSGYKCPGARSHLLLAKAIVCIRKLEKCLLLTGKLTEASG